MCQILYFESEREKEIKERILEGWKNFWSLKNIYEGKIETETKTRVWKSCNESVLTYGARVWSFTKSNIKRIQATQRAMERSMLGKKKEEKNTKPSNQKGNQMQGHRVLY